MALFAQCGSTPNVCKPKITCSSFEALVDGFYNQNGVQIYNNSNCQYLFVSYVNTQLGSNYTFSQLAAIYNYTCGNSCTLDVCSFPNHFLLTRVYNAFIAANPHPWNLPNCQQAFVDYFNTYFGLATPLTWSQIQQYYPIIDRHCTPDLTTLCTPPYSCTDLTNLVNNFHLLDHSPIPCEEQFTTYFNGVMGTNYTFAQLQALYLSICGVPLTVCDVVTDCKKMVTLWDNYLQSFIHPGYPTDYDCSTFDADFVQMFNDSLETNYTSFAQLQALYKKCDYDLVSPCSGGLTTTPAITPANLSAFLNSFNSTYPDPATQLGANCQSVFTANFNANFGSLLSYSEIASYYLSQLQITLNVCSSKCSNINALIASFNTHYGSLKLPLAAKQDLFTFLYNQAFVTSTGGKADNGFVADGSGGVTDGGKGTATDPKVFNPSVGISEIMTAISNCGINSFNLTASSGLNLYDAQTLLSLKQVYYIIHPNGMPDACQTDFAGWFNRVMQVQYTYNDILTLYNNVCGNNAGYICEPPPATTTDVSVYVNFMGAGVPTNLPPMLCGLNEPGGGPVPIEENPCKDLPKIAFHFAQEKYDLYVDSLRNVFDAAYREKCMAAKDLESFTVTYQQSEYHYTLYYYDQAGNLVKTVPPVGVQPLNASQQATVKQLRQNVLNGQPESSNILTPAHTRVTQYRYNTLNQVVAQQTPDAGVSKFFYDRLARLVVSQNAKQVTANNYSYTLYDDLGRIKEVGQLNTTTAITQVICQNGADVNTSGSLANWLNNKPAEQITRTFYDKSYIDGQGTLCPQYLCQANLRNRISYTAVFNIGVPGGTGEHQQATYYSYDIHGNVYELLQDYNSGAMKATGNRFKKIAYNYDLISGKVNSVAYQPGAIDAFYHRYSYDAENRITLAETSADKVVWEKDAQYNYYKHGLLARTVIGELQVQGIDYAYNLNGWLKGINSTSVGDGSFDIGSDGKIGSANSLVARDVFGFSLNYFDNDYKSIASSVSNTFFSNALSLTNTDGNKTANQLYNGNIAAVLVNIPKIGEAQLYGYKYDQLNRIKSMDAFTGLANTSNIFTSQAVSKYKERITYDANGNIFTYKRNGDLARIAMDDMLYSYKPNTNQLDKVVDNALDVAASEYDKYNDIKQGQQNGNYTYDAIGNLISDVSEGISNISWNVYGKINSISKTNGNTIAYTYDVSGNRISKTVNGKETWYIRDANGNVLSIYEKVVGGNLMEIEAHMYGSSRIGIINVNRDMSIINNGNDNFERGKKVFEMSNHLENVVVTISDKKKQTSTNGISVDYYEPNIVTATDYYLFGMTMPGRIYVQETILKYRYGFNGKENDNDISEGGQDYGMRIYDSRLGRFLSVDPLSDKYPFYTPYQFAANTPTNAIDLDGMEAPPEKNKNPTEGGSPVPFIQPYIDILLRANDASKLPKLNFTDKQLNEFAATIVCEAHNGRLSADGHTAFIWTYLSIAGNYKGKKDKVDLALSRSSAHKGESPWYKGIMAGLGNEKYKDQKVPERYQQWMSKEKGGKAQTYSDWGDANAKMMIEKAKAIKEYVKIASQNPILNPYPKFQNQGFTGDMNKVRTSGVEWYQVRAYLWLQKDGLVPNDYQHTFVIEFKEPGAPERSYIINQEAILAYFKEHKDKLPTPDKVPEVDAATGNKKPLKK